MYIIALPAAACGSASSASQASRPRDSSSILAPSILPLLPLQPRRPLLGTKIPSLGPHYSYPSNLAPLPSLPSLPSDRNANRQAARRAKFSFFLLRILSQPPPRKSNARARANIGHEPHGSAVLPGPSEPPSHHTSLVALPQHQAPASLHSPWPLFQLTTSHPLPLALVLELGRAWREPATGRQIGALSVCRAAAAESPPVVPCPLSRGRDRDPSRAAPLRRASVRPARRCRRSPARVPARDTSVLS
ncbi:hypothetical protein CDD83_2658 [Cordyceps sp. RAO-2017]|nr:hypothetical protein CDD83_2658 [Cordyceps sp. RAO-2017]